VHNRIRIMVLENALQSFLITEVILNKDSPWNDSQPVTLRQVIKHNNITPPPHQFSYQNIHLSNPLNIMFVPVQLLNRNQFPFP
jgi:hypothetical protein